MKANLNISANRSARKWTFGEMVGRALWEYTGSLVFALIPRPFWGIRRVILRVYGARVGRDAHIVPSARIAIPWNLEIGDFAAIGDRVILYNLAMIKIGMSATVSQGAHLCAGTHDFRHVEFPLIKKPITIGVGAWVCSDAFVGPGVVIGDFAVVGARAVTMKNVAANEIVAGNPARLIGIRELADTA